MEVSKIKDWLQLAASLGVLAGLLLVVQEIRQANQLANANTTNSIYDGWERLALAEIDSDIKVLFVKSIESPGQLTKAEIARLDSWLIAVMSLYQRQTSMYYDFGFGTDPADLSGSDLAYYFGGRFARAWYAANRDWIASEPELAQAIDRIIETTPVKMHHDMIEATWSLLQD